MSSKLCFLRISGLGSHLHARAEVVQAALIAEWVCADRERPEGPDEFKWLGHGIARIK
jgi:hypothetical protein